MYTIRKEFSFSASHKLHGLSEDHPCSRLHGHNYVAVFELEAQDVVDPGWVFDYRNLDCIKHWIDNNIDHRHLNDLYPDMNPTAENLARKFYNCAHDILNAHGFRNVPLVRVGISETPKTWAFFYQNRTVTWSGERGPELTIIGREL